MIADNVVCGSVFRTAFGELLPCEYDVRLERSENNVPSLRHTHTAVFAGHRYYW